MIAVHNRRWMAGLMLGVVLLSGCGGAPKVPETIEQTSLIIDKDGRVVSHLVDVFDKTYYSVDELQTMAGQEVAAYNTANQKGETPPVTMEKVEVISGSKVLVSLRYDSTNTYETYNDSILFYGTIAEASASGYNFTGLNQVLYNADGDESIVSTVLNESDMAQRHVVLLAEKAAVYCPYKVAYASESALIKEDGSVDTAAMLPEEFPAIIVLDK